MNSTIYTLHSSTAKKIFFDIQLQSLKKTMSLSIIGNEKTQKLFSILGRSVSKGGTLLPRVGFTAPSEARAVIETQGTTPNGLRVYLTFINTEYLLESNCNLNDVFDLFNLCFPAPNAFQWDTDELGLL